MENNQGGFQEHYSHMEHEHNQLERDYQTLSQQWKEQSDAMQSLEQQLGELHQFLDAEKNKTTALEQAVSTWKAKYEERDAQAAELNAALNEGKLEIGQRDGQMNQLMDDAKKYQEHLDGVSKQYEHKFAQMEEYIKSLELDNQGLRAQLKQESERVQSLAQEGAVKQLQLESDATSALKRMEAEFMNQKAQWENASRHEVEQLKLTNADLSVKLESLQGINKSQSAEISQLMASLHDAEVKHQHQQEQGASQQVQLLMRELEQAKSECERLLKAISEKDATHAESLRSQTAEYEAKHNDFVSRVESQFQEYSTENDKLRAALEGKEKSFQEQSTQFAAEKDEEISKWMAECDEVESKLRELDHENEELRRDLEQCVQELEVKRKENAEMSEQIDQYLSPDNERGKEMELLHNERLRLEEQNHELQQQIELTRQDAAAQLSEARQVQRQVAEQQNVQRHSMRSLNLEKEDATRKMMALGAEKAALEFQLTSISSDKNSLQQQNVRLEQEKRALELRLDELMRQATREMETQQQNAAVASEDIRAQLQRATSELAQRGEQIRQGQQQLQTLEREAAVLRENNKYFEDEARSVRGQAEELRVKLESVTKEKAELESAVRVQSVTNTNQRALESDLSRKYEQLMADADRRVSEEMEKSKQQYAAMQERFDSQEKHYRSENDELHRSRMELNRQVEELTAACDQLEADLDGLRLDRENQEKVIQEMERDLNAFEQGKSVQTGGSLGSKRMESAYHDLQQKHEQFKKDVMAQLKEKVDLVNELEDDNADLQAKLERQKEMTRHLMDRSNAEKQEHHDEALGASKSLREHQDRAFEFENRVKELERKIQVDDQARTAKDQSVLHEKLQLEREHRTLQRRCEAVIGENNALNSQLEQKNAEIEEMHHEIQRNTDEMEVARNSLASAEQQLNQKLEEIADELDTRDAELEQKDMEIQTVHEAAQQTQKQLEGTIEQLRGELSKLRKQVVELQGDLRRAQRHQYRSDAGNGSGFDHQDDGTQSRVKTLQKRCDQLTERERALSDQVTRLQDERSAVVDQFENEMRNLNINVGRSRADGSRQQLDGALTAYLAEMAKQIRGFEEREQRADALIHRKDRQINELKDQIGRPASVVTPTKSSRRDSLHDDVQRQIDEMSAKVSSLTLENRKLRDARSRGWASGVGNDNRQDNVGDLETKCFQLENRVHDLKSENAKLKQNRLSKADAKTFVKEIEKLSSEVMEKDLQLQALRRRDAKLNSVSNTNGGASSSTGRQSERSKDLRLLVEQKEKKIMVLNDHLTELMKQSMRLQHENERYLVMYGALRDDATPVTPDRADHGRLREPSTSTPAYLRAL